ncbi:MAG: methyltransferase domain-containing protein [Phycisphaerae bacterium]
MRTRLSPANPYGYDRHGFAWEHVPAGSESHLDFGCYDGAFLASLRSKGVKHPVGLEISRDAVAQARRRFPDLDVRHIARTVPLPFGDGTFTSASLLDVVEHVHEQTDLLNELGRVLRDGGRLVVTVPRDYALSFLDWGNLKFQFPRLHRWVFCLRHSAEAYECRYVSNPDGLVGDVSAKKRWHEHFSERRLQEMLERAGFRVFQVDGAACFTRLLSPALGVLERIPGIRRVGRWLRVFDARCFESMNLFCVAEKSGARNDGANLREPS